MKKLYSGFDLCAPTTSVSMTINGPAPMILAMFMNTAIDQHVERYLRASGRWEAARAQDRASCTRDAAHGPRYRGELPRGHDGSGLGAARRDRRPARSTRETYETRSAPRR